MFKCKACISKDQHIQDLRTSLAFAQSLNSMPKGLLPTIDTGLELNAVLDGNEKSALPEAPRLTPEQLEELREADRIFSGNY